MKNEDVKDTDERTLRDWKYRERERTQALGNHSRVTFSVTIPFRHGKTNPRELMFTKLCRIASQQSSDSVHSIFFVHKTTPVNLNKCSFQHALFVLSLRKSGEVAFSNLQLCPFHFSKIDFGRTLRRLAHLSHSKTIIPSALYNMRTNVETDFSYQNRSARVNQVDKNGGHAKSTSK